MNAFDEWWGRDWNLYLPADGSGSGETANKIAKEAWQSGVYWARERDKRIAESHDTDCKEEHSTCCGSCGCTISAAIEKDEEKE